MRITLEVNERMPMQFIISTSDEVLLPQSGLALVGALRRAELHRASTRST